MTIIKNQNLLKNKNGYIYYLLGEGISKGSVFLLLAFYTNYLGKEDFGKLALFWVSVPLISVLIDFSQRSYVKYYYIHKGNNVPKLLVVLKYFCLIISSILLIVFFFKDNAKLYIVDKNIDYYILFSALLYAMTELYLSFYQIKGDFKKYNIIFILRNASPYLITALILHFMSGDVYTFMKVQLSIFFLTTVVLSKNDISSKTTFKYFLKKIRPSIKFSIPFIPAILSVLALSFSDRFIINYYYSEIEVAEYTVAYTVSSIFMAFFLATNKMWQKFILESLKANEIGKIIKTTKFYILIVFIVGFMVIGLRAQLVSLMSNNSYSLILDLIPTIILGMFFYFLYTILSNIPFYYKNSFLMALPAIIAALANVILNFMLIPVYGYKVAAITTTISYFVEFIVIYFICLKKYKTDILFNGLTKRFTS